MDQIARDLAWILSSPPLFGSSAAPCFLDQALPESSRQTGLPGDSKEHYQTILWKLTRRRSHLLGIYYETLWQHILQYCPGFRLLAHNLQVQSGQTTLGEFDLIYQQLNSNQSASENFYHRELAVKYYLGLPAQSSAATPWHHWVGPGLRDRMDRKLARLLSHQIILSETEEGKSTLKNLGINRVRQEILVQGYLFYPALTPCQPPERASQNHHRGSWIAISDLESWLIEKEQTALTQLVFTPLPKLQWLSRVDSKLTIDRLFTRQRISAHMKVRLHDRPQPLLVVAGQETQGHFREDFRFFVVPDHWQEEAMKVANL